MTLTNAGSDAHEQDGLSHVGDAQPGNWVDRFAPNSLKPWFRLIRADRPAGFWLLLWPCWWSCALAAHASDDLPNPVFLILFAIGAFAMRAAGCIYNDILDRDLDVQVERTKLRPLAARQISASSAAVLMVALCAVGLLVLIQFNAFAIALGFGSVGIVLIYPLMKRVTFWPQAVLGLAFAWGALMGWAATFGGLALPPVLIYLATVSWIIGYDTIYAHQDKEDDALIGLKSTALLFGGSTKLWLTGFYGATVAGLVFAGWLIGAGATFFAFVAIAAMQFWWQVSTLDIKDQQNCLIRFRSNQYIGAVIFFGLVLDVIAADLI